MKTSRDIIFYWGGTVKNNLYIRSCGEFVLEPPDREDIETLDFGEIFWPISGECVFKYEGKSSVLRPGHVWYYPPGSLQDYFPLESFHYCWLTFAGADSRKIFEMLSIQPGLNPAGSCPLPPFSSIVNDIQFFTKEYRLKVLATAFKILTLISSGHSQAESEDWVMEIKKYIDDNCGDRQLTVEKIADDWKMHRVSISRAFHRKLGITISDYIISCRLKSASELLMRTGYPLSKIAELCGMSSAHYFGKVFMKKTGVTPSEFRRKFQNAGKP